MHFDECLEMKKAEEKASVNADAFEVALSASVLFQGDFLCPEAVDLYQVDSALNLVEVEHRAART